jgi:hypothetical protein
MCSAHYYQLENGILNPWLFHFLEQEQKVIEDWKEGSNPIR